MFTRTRFVTHRLSHVAGRKFGSSYSQIPKLSSLQEFQEQILDSKNGVKVIDFYATWCGPCKAMTPHISKMMQEYPSVDFYKVDVDQAMDVARSCDISAMPTFMLVKDGRITSKVVGANPAALENGIKDTL
ncbi:similar to Saccharomyces cerevisiae YCR083W TRX3 Mitochondrial thioredoxin [Maudiozyma barnettii]|uniref:Similar to Saccharomyces cerevisiae YCR083W TRX3 Mitochondrial thioredoxin n=1 Tax=Maudiozyma barnettii TaxID=61262 RepID=A0A8H2VFU2_9SACH|nr:Trx3p [Kazachstania barnettii]CAB4254780.1 similar to Saccharomyces cerevisiae YCR083W TRX3 Mitochondrial thioredoxin [Kazachstania barnettii]CAD1782923.1 similar to Saccharomyces cerevisiae YCR083W TRX3 Mitochondrial thioredoxin [Kazachstania barnettii]